MAGAWDGGCLTRNTQRQQAQQKIADDLQSQINKLRTEVSTARAKALQAQRDMAPTRKAISDAQANINRSLAELEQGKALNNTEALKARAELQEGYAFDGRPNPAEEKRTGAHSERGGGSSAADRYQTVLGGAGVASPTGECRPAKVFHANGHRVHWLGDPIVHCSTHAKKEVVDVDLTMGRPPASY